MSGGAKSTWRIEPLASPSVGHAADAVELVEGEAVRRVTLAQVDCLVLKGQAEFRESKERDPYGAELARQLGLTAQEVDAALRRLAHIGLITINPDRPTLQ